MKNKVNRFAIFAERVHLMNGGAKSWRKRLLNPKKRSFIPGCRFWILWQGSLLNARLKGVGY